MFYEKTISLNFFSLKLFFAIDMKTFFSQIFFFSHEMHVCYQCDNFFSQTFFSSEIIYLIARNKDTILAA